MVNEINTATPAPNTLSNVNNNDDVQKNQEEESNAQAEETSDVNSIKKTEQNAKGSNAETEETAQVESAQRGNEANAKPPASENESPAPGSILDILG
jgi:hypothetical protein